ncbi:hypothetical protein [Acidipila sp. EB88]|uniref:hypothetical protein n=1 Tax=Acidipila sp. EB88 TaxID=2305226 RepID=UPI000F5FE42D|nr:hypothetical protein [Acidipila sp. EB88]RRA48729.1 hypothetical protein D1Y84_10985 [Acidipila sp. EB88]
MTFQKLSRALLCVTGAVGMTLGLTSCSNDRTVGYVYVLGTSVSGQTGVGAIGAFKEDNNNGNLTAIAGAAASISSGGANPIRAVVPTGNRFMYVLNQGTATQDTSTSSSTYLSQLYTSANISLFSIGGYGQLSQQLQYASQGYGSTRMALSSGGNYLLVLDQFAPVGISGGGATSPNASTTASTNFPCLGSDNLYHPVGDISVYSIDASTGRLQVQPNNVNTALTYFPVGCFPVDFRVTASYVYVVDAGSVTTPFHTNDVQTVFVQAISATGQLTNTQTNVQQISTNMTPSISAITGDSSSYIYLLDTLNNLIYDYSIGSSGTLVAVNGSPFPNNTTVSGGGPVQSVVDSTGKYLFLANGQNVAGNASSTTTSADVTGYNINATTGDLDVAVQNGGFTLGTVSSPVCIFEDPTNQYLYVAGAADNSITGRIIDPNTGTLKALNKNATVGTVGTPSWCLGISSAL